MSTTSYDWEAYRRTWQRATVALALCAKCDDDPTGSKFYLAGGANLLDDDEPEADPWADDEDPEDDEPDGYDFDGAGAAYYGPRDWRAIEEAEQRSKEAAELDL